MSKRRSFVPALVALAVIAVVGVAAWAAWPMLMQRGSDEKAAPDVVVGEVNDRPAPGTGEGSEPEANQAPSEPTLDSNPTSSRCLSSWLCMVVSFRFDGSYDPILPARIARVVQPCSRVYPSTSNR